MAGKVTAALLSALVLLGGGWAWATWRTFAQNIVRVDALPAPVASRSVSASPPPTTGTAQNILIVGNDDRDTATDAELRALRTTRDGSSYNTDTMMVVHIPGDGSKATVMSIPRDSYVAIPGHASNKINAAYADGINSSGGSKSAGAQLAVATVQNLTGLHIDHFVQVDLIGFYRISLAIGGVQVTLCQATSDPNSGANFPAGPQTITGSNALSFVRQRDGFPNGLGDLDRIKRQQYFLSAVFRKLSSAGVLLNPVKLQKLLSAVSRSLAMDRTLDPLTLAEQLQGLTAGNLVFATIPWDGFANQTIDGSVQSTVVVNPTQVRQYVAQVLQPATTAHSSANVGGSGPSGTNPSSSNEIGGSRTAARSAVPTPPAAQPSGVITAQQAATGCID
jgi:LCP family protein required for cell wall assembly